MNDKHLQEIHQGVSRLKFESRAESNIVTTADQVRIIFCKHDIIFSHNYYIYAFPLFPITGQDTFETFLSMSEEEILADSSGHIFDPVNGVKFFGDLEPVIPKALWALLAVKEAVRQRRNNL